MKQLFKRTFALTDKGAGDLIRDSASSFLVYAANLLPAILLMFMIDTLVMEHVKSKAFFIIFSIAVLLIMYLLLQVDYDTLYSATYKESANLRMEIAEILSRLPLSYFSKHDLSDLSQTIMSDVEQIEHAMSHALSKTIGFLVFFPVVAVLLLIGNVKLGLAVILPILIGFLLVLLSKKLQISETTRHYEKLRENSEAFQEAIELQQEIKSFGMTQEVKKSLYRKMEESERIHLRTEILQGIPMFFANFVCQTSIGVVIIAGTFLYQTADINLLYLLCYVLAAMKLKEGVDGINENIAEIFYLDARIERIREMRETKVQEGADKELENYDIELQNVSFAYDADNQVLKQIDFTARQNEVTALVGMSGCGKTSILRLISRLFDYDGGRIQIGGVDLKEISARSLFKKISIVFQDVTLFNTSVMENIRLGKPSADDEEVIRAAKLANCEEFIHKLPDGYQTRIGENGASLSGGERQRISIARAFLKDAKIIILDEIAASLDVDNEKKIQDSLNKLIENKTVVIISHRMKSIENADKIVVIDGGRVEAFGTHRQLLDTSGIYNKLVQKASLAEAFQY